MCGRLPLNKRKSLADLLADAELCATDAVTQLPGGALWILSGAAKLAGNPLSDSDRLLDRINELRRCFDFILIDTPPLNTSQDAVTLAQLADAAVLVMPATGLHREAIRRFKQRLDAAGVTLLGAIVTT